MKILDSAKMSRNQDFVDLLSEQITNATGENNVKSNNMENTT